MRQPHGRHRDSPWLLGYYASDARPQISKIPIRYNSESGQDDIRGETSISSRLENKLWEGATYIVSGVRSGLGKERPACDLSAR
jgi:hypothetical protein